MRATCFAVQLGAFKFIPSIVVCFGLLVVQEWFRSFIYGSTGARRCVLYLGSLVWIIWQWSKLAWVIFFI